MENFDLWSALNNIGGPEYRPETPRQERIPIVVEVLLDSSSGRRDARISDLSLGGCYVDTIATPREGESINLAIYVPSSREVMSFTGVVAYSLERFGFGIRFTELTDDRLAFLKRIIDAY